MRSRMLSDNHGTRTFVVALDTGDPLIESITRFAAEQRLAASEFTAIGALASARLAYFDPARRDYVHCVLSRRDGSAVAGHLIEAEVRPTAEVFITDSPAALHRRIDPESGLPVIDPDVE